MKGQIVMESKTLFKRKILRPFLSILANGKQDSRKAGKNANLCKLTSAVEIISIQQVPCPTAAGKATNSIGTDLFTASIDSITLIDVWWLQIKTDHQILHTPHNYCQCHTKTSNNSILGVFTSGES